MQAHLFIFGFVQGVGYRRFLRSKAKGFGLKGWVRNTTDGRVEALIQGEKEKITDLVNTLEKGNLFSDVKRVQVEWEKIEDSFEDFKILR